MVQMTKELNTLLKAINRQLKTDKNSFQLCLLPEDYTDDLSNNPGEQSEPMQWSVRGNAELTLLFSDEDDSMLDVLAAFPQPTFHIRQRPNVGARS